MKTLLTRTRPPADALPGLVGLVREVTATDPAIAELFRLAQATARAVEEAKLPLATRHRPANAGLADLLDRIEDAKEQRTARTTMDELQRDARTAHQAWSEAVIKAARAPYRDLIRQKAKILEQVSALEIEHDGLIAALNDSNVSGFAAILRPMSLSRGELRLDLPYTTASLWLAEARSFGLLD
jgi:hypothetical protein